MAITSLGSLTKELPLRQVDDTILAIRPGITLAQLRQFAARYTHNTIPGLLVKRFLLVGNNGEIVYDKFLSLVASEGISSSKVRKAMYLIWALRDPRLREFITEIVADRNGKWRVSELTRKSNAKFFERFFEPRTAPKVRSNVEFFLVQTGILDLKKRLVRLGLEDDWVAEALKAAAQHETDWKLRQAMITDPIRFLADNNLNALVNASRQELNALAGPVLTLEPVDDVQIEVSSKKKSLSQSWNRAKPTASERRYANTVIDLVARERANNAHWMLEKLLNDSAIARGYAPKQNKNIDMHFATPNVQVLAEMKSCHRGNLHSQVRRGVAQLLEYRFLYRDQISDNPLLLLLIETAPGQNEAWIVRYLESLGILLAWKAADKLVSASLIPDALSQVIFPIIGRE